jgi:hypothetical protein
MRKGMFRGPIAKTAAVFATVLVLACSARMVLAAQPKAFETDTVARPESVGGYEYKFLVQPGARILTADQGFREVWSRVKASAARNGYVVTERKNDPLKIETSTKEYFDTRDQALWRAGYVLRITTHHSTHHEGRKPDSIVNVTVKAIHEDASRTLATPLTVVGVQKVSVDAEENIGFVPGGKLGGYVEKGASFSVPLELLGKFTLGDFGRYMPELLGLGLPADTALAGVKVFSWSVKPGAIALPGIKPSGVTMEAWSKAENGVPEIFDFSFGYKTGDSHAAGQTRAAAEQFMVKVLQAGLSEWRGPADDQWGGSKVRRLMDRPVATR